MTRTTMASRKTQVETNCLDDARAFAADFPETAETALFAYEPEALSEPVRARLEDLFAHNAGFKRIVEDMRKDRKWLAPQYGLK
jgi:hypothetical protein